MALPAAGTVSVRVPRRVKQLRPPCAPLLAFWVWLGGTPCPKGWERASRHQYWGETENVLAGSIVLHAYQWCAGRANVPNCSCR